MSLAGSKFSLRHVLFYNANFYKCLFYRKIVWLVTRWLGKKNANGYWRPTSGISKWSAARQAEKGFCSDLKTARFAGSWSLSSPVFVDPFVTKSVCAGPSDLRGQSLSDWNAEDIQSDQVFGPEHVPHKARHHQRQLNLPRLRLGVQRVVVRSK